MPDFPSITLDCAPSQHRTIFCNPEVVNMKTRAAFFTLVFFILSIATFAQTSRGTVSGTVTDPTGAVISGANVTLTNTATTVSRSTVTNSEGIYRFDAVDLGDYTIKFTATGFGEVLKSNVVVSANQIAA